MPYRKVSLSEDEFYHLYNRGNNKREIFHDKEDYFRFMALMFACNQVDSFKIDNLNKTQSIYSLNLENKIVSIGSYVLMPNHYHILIREKESGGISKFMQKLNTAYVMYYNKKYKKTGSLFEGRFKSKHLDNENYLKYIFSYIHLNPVKLIDKQWKEKGIQSISKTLIFLSSYQYSSYLDYMYSSRIQNKILNTEYFPDYFKNKKVFKNEIFMWINYNLPPLGPT